MAPGHTGTVETTPPSLRLGPDGRTRCWWCGDDPLYVDYHDHEWGRPQHDDRALFEKICLEGFQAGLSWISILRKRERFREVFRGFRADVVAVFDENDVRRLLDDEGIVRHRGKIEAVINNARCVTEQFALPGAFAEFVWSHAPATAGQSPLTAGDIRASTPESHRLSRSLRALGWKFVGPTTMHAFMQSMGLVNDHVAGCEFRDR